MLPLDEPGLLERLHLAGDRGRVEAERRGERAEPLGALVGELAHDAVGRAVEVTSPVAVVRWIRCTRRSSTVICCSICLLAVSMSPRPPGAMPVVLDESRLSVPTGRCR